MVALVFDGLSFTGMQPQEAILKKKFSLKKTKVVLNSLTARYFI